jgi:hypothetical protein
MLSLVVSKSVILLGAAIAVAMPVTQIGCGPVQAPEEVVAGIVNTSPYYDNLSRLSNLEKQSLVGAHACGREYSLDRHEWSFLGPKFTCPIDKMLPQHIRDSVKGVDIFDYLKANKFACVVVSNKVTCTNSFSYTRVSLRPNPDIRETIVTTICFRQIGRSHWSDLKAWLVVFGKAQGGRDERAIFH